MPIKEQPIHTHSFNFNPEDNGGESLTLTTKFIPNGDPDERFYTNQEITLNSYGNCASIKLFGAQITADVLRKLANELDAAEIEYRKKFIALSAGMDPAYTSRKA